MTNPRTSPSILVAALGAALPLLAAPVAEAQRPRAPVNGGGPQVSPDGRYVLFSSEREGRPDLWLVREDGTGARRLTDSPEHESTPEWLGDGRRVAYGVHDRQTDTTRVYVLPIDGGAPTLLAAGRGYRGAAVSPDRRRLVVSAGTWPIMHLEVVDVVTGVRRPLTSAGRGFDYGARWSPDGRQVAYVAVDTATREGRIVIADADGANARTLVAGRGVEQPAWSRDGRWIAYQRSGGRDTHDATIHVVAAAGGEPRLLTPHERAYLDETPSWFPDGRRLAIQSDRDGRMEVYVIRVDGGGAVRLTR